MWLHLTARTHPELWPLADPQAAAWLWARLRRAFPQALGAVLMENHLHLVVFGDAGEARRRLAAVLSGFTRRFGENGARIWLPVATPTPIQDLQKLARQIRYLALNPCRTAPPLAEDPLEWLWSTHRDVMGAAMDPWVTADRLADALGWARRGVRDRWHRYVSSVPHVEVAGTAPPVAAEPREAPIESLDVIARAAAAAVRGQADQIRVRSPVRAVFLQLAARQGWGAAPIAAACDMLAPSVQEERRPLDLAPAALCLGDARLISLSARRSREPMSS